MKKALIIFIALIVIMLIFWKIGTIFITLAVQLAGVLAGLLVIAAIVGLIYLIYFRKKKDEQPN